MNPRQLRFLRRVGVSLLLATAVALLGRQIFFRGPFQPPAPLPAESFVDLHCHAAGIGAGQSGCFLSPRMRSNFRFRIYLQAFGVTEADLLKHGDVFLLQKLSRDIAASRHLRAAVVLAMDGVVDADGRLDTHRTEVFIPNDFIAQATLRLTNLLFGASIHPRRPDAIARLDQAVAQGAVLVKWIPSIMDIDPADPRYVPFYQRLAHHRIPLLSHTGPERSFTSSTDALANPDRLRLPLEQGVIVIAGHVAGGGETDGVQDLEKVRRLMKEFPNLYADISALTLVNRISHLRATLHAPECRGRLIYGSDFPLINTALVSPWYYPLNLAEAQRQTIAAMENPWDRDIALKQALGVPTEVFNAADTLLRHPQNPAATKAVFSGPNTSPGAQPIPTTTTAATATVANSSPPPGQALRSPSGASTNTTFNSRK